MTLFSVTVDLLGSNGTYDAEVDGRAEWPPAPARLVAALVAAAGPDRTPEETFALRWLCELPPPAVLVPPSMQGHDTFLDGTQCYVPTANVSFASLGLTASKSQVPRRRPSVRPSGDRFAFEWAATNRSVAAAHFAALAGLCRRVPYLGRATCPAAVTAVAGVAEDIDAVDRWELGTAGRTPTRVRSTTPHLIDELDLLHRWREERSEGSRKGLGRPRQTKTAVTYSVATPIREVTAQAPVARPSSWYRIVDGAVRSPRPDRYRAAVEEAFGRPVALLPDVGGTWSSGKLLGCYVPGLDENVADPTVDAVGSRYTLVTAAEQSPHWRPRTPATVTARRWTANGEGSPSWVTSLPLPLTGGRGGRRRQAEEAVSEALRADPAYDGSAATVTVVASPLVTGSPAQYDTRCGGAPGAHVVVALDSAVRGPLVAAGVLLCPLNAVRTDEKVLP